MIIKSSSYLISNVDWEKCPPPHQPEYAFIGRSNVGKSSLINMIAGKEGLAKISGTPGKTQLINHFLINENWYLVDLPGYGYAKRSQTDRKKWEKMIEDYLRNRKNLICVFLLIDSRLSPQKNDLEFIDQLGAWKVPFQLVFTKSDKNTPMATKRNVQAFLDTLKISWDPLPRHVISSTVQKLGRQEILDYISEWNTRFRAIA
ncbi:MAG: ribosome biogenesis GTP-binding protein YihA/YsxC [Chitinophagaceae bacterium]